MRASRYTAAIALLGLLSSACASRVPHDELVAANQAAPAAAAGHDAAQPAAEDLAPTTGITVGAGDAAGGDVGTGPSEATLNGGASNAPPGSSTGGAAATACTKQKSTLTIGAVGEQSGIFGTTLAPMTQAVRAWAASVNATGGVACHPIRFIVKDDNGDPATHQAMVRQLVEDEHVVAMVMMNAPLPGASTVQYLTSKGIPVIGTAGGEEWYYSSPVYRPQMTTGDGSLEAVIHAAAKVGLPDGKRNLGVIACIEAALCSSVFQKADQLAASAGLTLAYRGQVSILVPSDFSSQCQRAQASGVQIMATFIDQNSLQRLWAACDAVGFRPMYISGGILVTPSLLQDPRAVGFYVVPTTARFTDTQIPSIVRMRAALRQYAPNVAPSSSTAVGWSAAELFNRAVENATEPITPASLLAAIDALKNDDLGGISAPLTFAPGANAKRQTCFWIGVVNSDGTFGPPPGGPAGRTCV